MSKKPAHVEGYHNAIIYCMIEFQHIEEMIKMILDKIETITNIRLEGYAHYESEIKKNSIKNSAMGRLIQMLNAYTDDKGLIAELKEIKEKRDHVAHQSLLLTAKELEDKEFVYINTFELEKLRLDSEKLFLRLNKIWTDHNSSYLRIIAEQAYDKKDETTK